MPVVTITAINTGTEEFTATAHGLSTGDRFRLRNVGGALPAATPSLAAVTDYFAIRTSANALKVAVSSSDAQAGTAVNLTGSLTGTTTIEYGLPYCIPTALAALGTQIKSANANGEWNALVAIYDLLTGQAQSVLTETVLTKQQTFYFSAADAGTPAANSPALSVDHATTGAVVWTFTATTQRIAIPLSRLRVGDRIISFGARANTSSSLQLTVKLWFTDPGLAGGTGSATQVGSTLTHSNTLGDVTSTLGSPRDVAAGESFHITAGGTGSATSVFLFDVFVTVDRPLG